MSGKWFSTQAKQAALCFVVVALQYAPGVHCSNATIVHLNSTGVKSLLEYHFHTYFEVNDPVQVAHAIELRNEIIANCVRKKIIAVPLHYHYDPENPVLEHNNDTTGLNMVPVGPHPIGSFETWVPVEYFAKLYEWFLQKRSPLTIFVHPLTEQEVTDHTDRVVFMGKSYTLKTDVLRDIIPDFKSQYEYLKLGYANPDNEYENASSRLP